jgi:hypothetical protein
MWRGEASTGLWCGNLRKRDHWVDLGVEVSIILMDLQEVGCGGMDWIERAWDIDRWRALVNAVINIRSS